MKKIAEINPKDLDIIFVSNYYDRPLSGLCLFQNKISKYEIIFSNDDDEGEKYEIFSLTPIEKIKTLSQKKLFEICVGYHQTYKANKKNSYFYMRKPKWTEKLEKRTPQPWQKFVRRLKNG